jgi:hypothetical protein
MIIKGDNILSSPAADPDPATEDRCYMCDRNADEIGKLLGVKAVEGFEFRTLYVREGGGISDSKVVNHRALNLCDSERGPTNHKKFEVALCPICKSLINSMATPLRMDMVQTTRRV